MQTYAQWNHACHLEVYHEVRNNQTDLPLVDTGLD